MDKSLPSRILVGFFGVVIVLLANWLHTSSFIVVFLFFWSLSSLELIRLIDANGNYRLFMLLYCLLIGLLYPGYGKVIPIIVVIIIWVINSVLIFFQKNLSNTLRSISFPLYVTIPYIFLVIIRTDDRGAFWIFFLLLSTWILDIFSYFTGLLFGKHPIAPAISPKKTVEGTIGGFLFSSAFIYIYLQAFTSIELLHNILIAITIPVVGFAGDLFESSLKRRFSIKDSGDLLGGHGGFLDRFDSILFVAVLFIIFQRVLHWL